MALADFFTTAQLEIAMGGAQRVVQLAKATGPSDAVYAAFVAEVKANVNGDVYAITQVAFDVADANLQAAGFLKQKALALACYWAHFSGSGGQEVPEQVVRARDLALAQLRELRDGGTSLGIEAAVGTSAQLAQVNPDPAGVGITRSTLGDAGFA